MNSILKIKSILILIVICLSLFACERKKDLKKSENLTFYKNWEWGWQIDEKHTGNLLRLIILENNTYILLNVKTKKQSAGMLKIKESNYFELKHVKGDEINDVLPYPSNAKGRLRYDGVLILETTEQGKDHYHFMTSAKAMGFDS